MSPPHNAGEPPLPHLPNSEVPSVQQLVLRQLRYIGHVAGLEVEKGRHRSTEGKEQHQ